MFARPFIDSLDFALHGKELRGSVAISELSRLADLLAAPVGEMAFLLRGYALRDGEPMLALEVHGSCRLICQRCLDALEYPVALTSQLKLQSGEVDEFSDDGEEFDTIAADRHLDVVGLIEEELLLALPISPRHAEGECRVAAVEGESQRNPFAVLATLKKS